MTHLQGSEPDEPQYTLNEAQRVLARRECAYHGHDFDTIVNGAGDPRYIVCSRCGESWTVITK